MQPHAPTISASLCRVLNVAVAGGERTLSACQFAPKIGSMVQAGYEVAIDRGHIQFCGAAPLDNRSENPSVGIVLKRENTPGTIWVDHELAGGIRDHPSGNAAMQRFYCATVGKRCSHPRIAVCTATHSGEDRFEVSRANEVNHFPVSLCKLIDA